MNQVVLIPKRSNSFSRRGLPNSPENSPREISSGESSPPYDPSQPATASTSTPNPHRISFAMTPSSAFPTDQFFRREPTLRSLPCAFVLTTRALVSQTGNVAVVERDERSFRNIIFRVRPPPASQKTAARPADCKIRARGSARDYFFAVKYVWLLPLRLMRFARRNRMRYGVAVRGL